MVIECDIVTLPDGVYHLLLASIHVPCASSYLCALNSTFAIILSALIWILAIEAA